jgi:hypothetical protein
MYFYRLNEWEFYDLKYDPAETYNEIGNPEYADQVRFMKSELSRLQDFYGERDPENTLEELTQAPLRRKASSVGIQNVYTLEEQSDGFPVNLDQLNLDPSARPLTVGGWIRPERSDAVIVSQGGESYGYALHIEDSIPYFTIRSFRESRVVFAQERFALREFNHLVGVLTASGALKLYVNGKLANQAEGLLLDRRPNEGLNIGGDTGTTVSEFPPVTFTGTMKDLRLYYGELPPSEIADWAREKKVP